MTNADRIRNMSNEELAKEMVVPFMHMCGYLPNCVFHSNHCEQFNDREEAWKEELEWLESEVKEG